MIDKPRKCSGCSRRRMLHYNGLCDECNREAVLVGPGLAGELLDMQRRVNEEVSGGSR